MLNIMQSQHHITHLYMGRQSASHSRKDHALHPKALYQSGCRRCSSHFTNA